MKMILRNCIAVVAMAVTTVATMSAYADSQRLDDDEKDYLVGAPAHPSDEWIIAKGYRLYDNWMTTLDKDDPDTTHPAWPLTNKKRGATTWRCKSCHGWDLKGIDGAYAEGSHKTGIIGITGVIGKDPDDIQAIISNETHRYTDDMIPKDAMAILSKALSIGQYDTDDFIKADGTVIGDVDRGRAIFQNVCAVCHGFDGTALDWGDEYNAYIGTEANANPWEVIAKIRHGHAGVNMVALIAFPMSDIASVLKYTRTLPD